MTRFVSAVCLCSFLLVAGFFVFSPQTGAQNDFLQTFIDLPAPPPPNPFFENLYRKRPEGFFSKNKPPDDDAPIEDVLDYWRAQNEQFTALGYKINPSKKNLERILEEIERDPESLTDFIDILPENEDVAEFVKRIYDKLPENKESEDTVREETKKWLTYHSKFFIDELFSLASRVGEDREYVSNQESLLALTRLDWNKAQPIVERLYNDRMQPVSRVLAHWAFYLHAHETDSTGDIDKYRDELKAIVADKSATAGMRDLAMDALVSEKEWAERDEWYRSLLEDDTLGELRVNGQVYTGLTTLLLYSPPEKYADKMIELAKSDNPAVRNAAVRNLANLLDENNPEVVRALLPWLEDPKWAKEVGNERRSLVAALQKFMLPESVPGLIAMLNEKEVTEVPAYLSNTAVNSNIRFSNSNTATKVVESFPYRSAAVSALAVQKDVRAAPALRALLPKVEDYQRQAVVRALLLCHGFSVSEQIEALEYVIKNGNQTFDPSNSNMPMVNTIRRPAMIERVDNLPLLDEPRFANNGIDTYRVLRSSDPSDIKAVLGNQIVSNPEPSSSLIAALIDRIGILDREDPKLAWALRNIMLNWRGVAINSLLLRDLKNGRATLEEVLKLLSIRRELRENQAGEIYDLGSGGNKIALGISACILEDQNEYGAILSGENAESKIAMLGCARLIRANLPIQSVAKYLKDPNKMLALVAERYLESEDSPEARAIVLSLHPNEAKILGATTVFSVDGNYILFLHLDELFATVNLRFSSNSYDLFMPFLDDMVKTEKRLQDELKATPELLGVYAYDKNFIRIYKDKAVFSWDENEARYRERNLTNAEFEYFKSYIASQRADELPSFLSYCGECDSKELLMLGRGGGRRVFLESDKIPPFFAGLDEMFEDMQKPPAKLHYYLEKDIPGLEILFADNIYSAETVWKNGDDFRVLINDTDRRIRIDKELDAQEQADEEKDDIDYEKYYELSRKRREQRKYENFSWFRFEANKLSGFVSQPPQIDFIPPRDAFAVAPSYEQWKARTATIEIRADSKGLYKITRGALSKIRSGVYASPAITANGRWAVAAKYTDEKGLVLARVNLLTGKEFITKVEEYPICRPVAFIPSLTKVLIGCGYYGGDDRSFSRYVLLDPETGLVEKPVGEIHPLAQQTFRPLQPAGTADEFWAAIPDAANKETVIGTYNSKTLSFKPLLKIPRIQFSSMDMWIDKDKVYFVFEGHLLSLPLPKSS